MIFAPIALALLFIVGLLLGPTILNQAAEAGEHIWAVCFQDARSINDLVPLIWYTGLAVTALGAVGTAVFLGRRGQLDGRIGMMTGAMLVFGLMTTLSNGVTPTAYAQGTDSCLRRDGSLAMTGNLNMDGNLVLNIGNAATDFNSTGGLTLADALTVDSGGIDITGESTITGGATTTALLTVTAGGASITGDEALDGDLDFTGAQEISTTAGNLTVAPAGNLILEDGLNLIGTTTEDRLTRGLAIDQTGADDGALILSDSTDVDNGAISSRSEGTYLTAQKNSGTEGGAIIVATAEDGGAAAQVLVFHAEGGTPNTTKTTAGRASFEFLAREHDGDASFAAATANANIFAFRANPGGSIETILLADEDGDLFLPRASNIYLTTDQEATGAGALVMGDTTDVTVLGTNTGAIWADDVAGTVEVFATDEAGNDTQLSPHPADFLEGTSLDCAYPWAFHSRNDYLGKEVYVDWCAFIMAVEALTGQTFMFVHDIPKRDWNADQVDRATKTNTQRKAILDEMDRLYDALALTADGDEQSKIIARLDELADALPGIYVPEQPPNWLKSRGVGQ